ncbi:hypothetical protein DBZ36_15185 [Alginatibacterium sediminis]|uniref:Uncharacterized protein n=1 Tax=Alginatibacterium sediminis TaxID=2164068 RepID=A0A420E8P0_9ALTE|nr:hypothetical protein [Alginatibacterium sediminis]RKF15723.1 hypothetical protein DBZ36_15185 [Alginatibacterium sediminis]
MTYEVGAFLADCYTPVLVAISLWIFYRQRAKGQPIRLDIRALALSLVLVYALMLLDAWLGIWPALNLDYSTHTAIALAFCAHHITYRVKWTIPVVLGLLAYLQLMKFMHYHSYLDMLTTSLCLVPLLWMVWLKRNRP